MEQKIRIPEPCHEDWNNMLPEEQGRHCLSCCKTVVDFSGWETEQIMTYLQNRQQEHVCGRFNAAQVSSAPFASSDTLAAMVLRSGLPFFRKIAAVIVICFGLLTTDNLYAQKIMGKPAAPSPRTDQGYTKGEVAIVQADSLKTCTTPDTLQPAPQIMGRIAPYHPPKPDTGKKKAKDKKR